MELYGPAYDAARAHAQKEYDRLMNEAKPHKAILDLEITLETYLAREKLAAATPVKGVDAPEKVIAIPTPTSSPARSPVPLGKMEPLYESAAVAILKENEEANIDMFVDYFRKVHGISVPRGGVKGFFGRAKRSKKLISGRYSFVIAGPNFSQMIEGAKEAHSVGADPGSHNKKVAAPVQGLATDA